MNVKKLLEFLGLFLFHTIVTACVMFSLIHAVGILSGPASFLELSFAMFLLFTSGSVVFNGVRYLTEDFINSKNKEQQ